MPHSSSTKPFKATLQTMLGTAIVLVVSFVVFAITRTIGDFIPVGLVLPQFLEGLAPPILTIVTSGFAMWCAFVALKFFIRTPPVKPLLVTLGILYALATILGAFTWLYYAESSGFEAMLNGGVFLLFALTGFRQNNWDDLPPRG